MYFGLSIFQQRFHNHFAYILCQIKSNLPRHSWHSTDFSWLRLPANAVGWRAGKSLMKILSRSRHLPIAENCAQIISILKRNHWNLSISASTPTTADAGRHDDAVTDIRPDGGATLWDVKIKYLWYFWAQFLAFGKSKLQIFIWHRLAFAFAFALLFFHLVLFPFVVSTVFAIGFMCVPFGKFNLVFIFLARAVGFPMNFWECSPGAWMPQMRRSHIS